MEQVALFARAWIEIMSSVVLIIHAVKSPSLRGRGLKSYWGIYITAYCRVALFARAWIEIAMEHNLISGLIGRPLCEGVD